MGKGSVKRTANNPSHRKQIHKAIKNHNKRFRMIYIILILQLVLSITVSCVKRGALNERCKKDGTCNTYYACGDDGRCHPCGGDGELCCPIDKSRLTSICDTNHECWQDGLCHACGGEDLPPCTSGGCKFLGCVRIDRKNVCSLECSPGEDGLCHCCGGADEACCQERKCSEGYACDAKGLCAVCGDIGQICCDENACQHSLWSTMCTEEDICVRCGRGNDPCCPDNTCDEWYECDEDGLCQPCGRLYARSACEGERCMGWLENMEGQCIVPFVLDPDRDLSICDQFVETTRRSSLEEESSDWCYWYAAFWKRDSTICQQITWVEMREKCLEKKDPDDYYVTPF